MFFLIIPETFQIWFGKTTIPKFVFLIGPFCKYTNVTFNILIGLQSYNKISFSGLSK